MPETDAHTIHLDPGYPIKAKRLLAIVKGIVAAREVVAAAIAMELPTEFLDPSEIRKEVRSSEEAQQPIWVAAHDNDVTIRQAAEALFKIDDQSSILLDWDPDEAVDEDPQDAEDDDTQHKIEHYQTALVMLAQAQGNSLQAAANVHALAGVAEDPDFNFHVLGVLIETFPFVYKGLVEAGLVNDAAG